MREAIAVGGMDSPARLAARTLWGMSTAAYDPFAAGRFPVGVRTIQALDPARGRLFPCEVWYPARTGSAGRPAGPAADRDTADRDTA